MPDINHHPNEIWKPVVGYEGLYEVSSCGRVRSLDRSVPGRAGHAPMRLKGRVLKARENRGYPALTLHRGGKSQAKSVHALVLEAFVGPRPDNCYGCHNDGDSTNNRLENLRWDSQSNNQMDTIRHGRHHQILKTHCPQGHEYSTENTVYDGRARKCRSCLRTRRRTGRPIAPELMRNKTHCPHGHEYTPENTYITPGIGSRNCRTCRKRRGKEQGAKRAEARRLRGVPIRHINGSSTHCRRGHLLHEQNLIRRDEGVSCKECRRQSERARYHRKLAEKGIPSKPRKALKDT